MVKNGGFPFGEGVQELLVIAEPEAQFIAETQAKVVCAVDITK